MIAPTTQSSTQAQSDGYTIEQIKDMDDTDYKDISMIGAWGNFRDDDYMWKTVEESPLRIRPIRGF